MKTLVDEMREQLAVGGDFHTRLEEVKAYLITVQKISFSGDVKTALEMMRVLAVEENNRLLTKLLEEKKNG